MYLVMSYRLGGRKEKENEKTKKEYYKRDRVSHCTFSSVFSFYVITVVLHIHQEHGARGGRRREKGRENTPGRLGARATGRICRILLSLCLVVEALGGEKKGSFVLSSTMTGGGGCPWS